MSAPTSPYQLLGVSPSSSAEEIHKAYRRLARRFHPDLSGNPAAADDMARINTAYESLRASHGRWPISQADGTASDSTRVAHTMAAEAYRRTAQPDTTKRTRRVDVRA